MRESEDRIFGENADNFFKISYSEGIMGPHSSDRHYERHNNIEDGLIDTSAISRYGFDAQTKSDSFALYRCHNRMI